MNRVEITSANIQTRSGISQRTGKPYTMREQTAWMTTYDDFGKANPYPAEIKLTLGDEQEPYAVGAYTMHPGSIYVGRFGSPEIRIRQLVPVVESKNLKAA